MNNATNLNESMFELLSPIFKDINNENWDQGTGYAIFDDEKNLMPNHKCCIGAHIAAKLTKPREYPVENYRTVNYVDGISFVLHRMRQVCPRMSHLMMCAFFHCAGSPEDPFSTTPWKWHPIDVLKNMKHIETLPPQSQTMGYDNCFGALMLPAYLDDRSTKKWLREERARIASGRCLSELKNLKKEKELVCALDAIF